MRTTALWCGIAYVIGVLFRAIWFLHVQSIDETRFDGRYLMTTHDAYFWAQGALSLQAGEGGGRAGPLSMLIFAISRVTGADIDAFLVFLPLFIAPLVAIPIVLLGRSLGSIWLGVLAAVFTAITPAYYYRTLPGYVDTDMLNLFFPIVVLWACVEFLLRPNRHMALIAGIFAALSVWWFPSIWTILIAFMGMIGLYTVVRREVTIEKLLLPGVLLTALLPFGPWLPIVATVLVWAAWPMLTRVKLQLMIPAAIVVAIAAGFTPAAQQAASKLWFYVAQSDIDAEQVDGERFYPVQQTIRELKRWSPTTIAKNLSGHIVILMVALAGCALMVRRFPVMAIAAPFLFVGLAGFLLGLRFNLFAVPLIGFGASYAALTLASRFKKQALPWSAAFLATMISPSLLLASTVNQGTIISGSTVEALKRVEDRADAGDVTLAWWDYGYLIRYYTGTQVFVDGGSMIESPRLFALSDMMICRDQRDGHRVGRAIAGKGISREVIDALAGDGDVPEVALDKDVYLFMTIEQLTALGMLKRFCGVDLVTGEAPADALSGYFADFREKEAELRNAYNQLKNSPANIDLDVDGYKIAEIIFVEPRDDMNPRRQIRWRLNRGPNVLIIRSGEGDAVMVDRQYLKTTMVQLLALGSYDPDLYEPIAFSQRSRIFRLRDPEPDP